MKVYIVRSAETDESLRRVPQGNMKNIPNEQGLKVMTELGKRLRKHDISKVYTSPSERAIKSAEAFANEECDIEVVENMKGRDVGEIEGMPRNEALRLRKLRGFKSLHDFGENITQFKKRLSESFETIVEEADEADYDAIVIVTHGSVIYYLLHELVEKKIVGFTGALVKAKFEMNPTITNSSVTIIDNDEVDCYNAPANRIV